MKEHHVIPSKNGSLNAFVTRAKTQSKGALVCAHGGPNGDYRGNNGIFDEMLEYCDAYDVLQFDMFGAGKSDGRPDGITLETQFEDYTAALRFARHNLSHPVHVVGESMGATIAALQWQPEIQTYILLWPAFDLRDTDLRPYLKEPWLGVANRQGYIEENGMVIGRNFLLELLSYDFSACFVLPHSPCMLIHGKADTSVPFEQSLKAISKSRGESVLFSHPMGDHGLQRPEERSFTHAAIRWWLRCR